MTATTATRRILITGRAAAEIAQHVALYVKPTSANWHEVQAMSECSYGCKLYVSKRGCVNEYVLFHSSTYGCRLGCDPATSSVKVSVAPKARIQAPAVIADDELLDRLGSAIPAPATEVEKRLVSMRTAAEADPIPDLVDVDTARAVIRGAL